MIIPAVTPTDEPVPLTSKDLSKTRTARAHTVDSWGYDWLCYEKDNGVVSKVGCIIRRDYYKRSHGKGPLHTGEEKLCSTIYFTHYKC